MGKRNKIWLSMQVATFAGITALTACSNTYPKHEGEGEGEGQIVIQGEGEGEGQVVTQGEGEGEGQVVAQGEGEGAVPGINLATNDLAYLTQLSLMRGHLFVGNQLYKMGHVAHAKTHMKHPKAELYTDVELAFSARGAAGFANELKALATAVEADKGKAAVNAAYAALDSAISASESKVSHASSSPAEKLKLAVALLRVAGEEYAIAVVDGKMENAHEYQDALGFTQIAKQIVNSIKSDDQTTSSAIEKAAKTLAKLDPMWPSLIPPATLQTEAGQLYGAASQIEILALGLE